MSEKKTVTVKLVRSVAGTRESHRATVRGLGLRKLNSQSTLEDTPAVVGFEGGQLPLQRRLPKRGFKSASLKFNAEVTLSDLQRIGADEVDLLVLKAAGLVGELIKTVKVIKSGELTRKVSLKGVGATVGAKAAIEAAGGSIA